MENKPKKILIASGGTGGHLYPSLVLAHYLKKNGAEIYLTLGINPNRKKLLTFPEDIKEIPYEIIPAAPLQNIKSLIHNFNAFKISWKLLDTFHPQGVIGFGSYATFPMLLAAYLKGIPVVLHEQNLIPGIANRIASIFAKKVAISFPDTGLYFSQKSVLVGNLVRSEMFQRTNKNKEFITLLVFGGSSGAKKLNELILDIVSDLEPYKNKIEIIHVTGSKQDAELIRMRLTNLGIKNSVVEYAQEISKCYQKADLVLCRSGASTITELIATEIPAILIPYPHATSNHQFKNAMILSKLGAAIVLQEDIPDLKKQLTELLLGFFKDPLKLKKMKETYHSYPISLKEAPQKLAELLYSQCL